MGCIIELMRFSSFWAERSQSKSRGSGWLIGVSDCRCAPQKRLYNMICAIQVVMQTIFL